MALFGRILLVIFLAIVLFVGCFAYRVRPTDAHQPRSEPGRHDVRVVETRRIVPSPGLPERLEIGASNNNLDVTRHQGRVFLAFRTAPHHFANPDVIIYVVSSDDEVSWRYEAEFQLGRDLREPRLLSHAGSLFLYVSRLGKDALAFEPAGMVGWERRADGSWQEIGEIGPPTYMGWRVRKLDGQPVMMTYSGGGELYSGQRPTLRVEMWKSDDGRDWQAFDPDKPAVYVGGGSESDFAAGDDGSLYAVIRNEGGDDTGWGSKVCRAEPGDPADWSCHTDTRKFDSPFMFWYDGEAYLVARRQLRFDGAYDLGQGPGWLLHTLWNQVHYSLTPKRCALWRYVQDEDRFAFILDLPSRGDTCFPAAIETSTPGQFAIYDYSCDIEGPDLRWIQGQRGETFIYRHVLRFEAR